MTTPADLRPSSRPVAVGELLLPTVLHLTTRGAESAATFATLLTSSPTTSAGRDGPALPPEPPHAPQIPAHLGRPAVRAGTRVTAQAPQGPATLTQAAGPPAPSTSTRFTSIRNPAKAVTS